MAADMASLKASQTENISTPERLQTSQSCLISKVKVIVRVRPFLPQEISARNGNSVSCASVLHSDSETSDEVTVHLKDYETSRKEFYKLDGFYGHDDNNVGQIFHKEVSHLIPGVFRGYNATVFAYGATGSGKTYTMQGSAEIPGLMPLAMSSILSICQSTGSTVAISYYEIYMDKCYDLLELKNKEVAILDDKDGQIHLKGLAQVGVNSMSGFHEIFSAAIQRRKVAQTSLNDLSSRSHGVLVISVSTPCHETSGNVITGKLNLIDLAGNEDNRRTCNEGIRLQESAKINQSLFALSNVIYALNNNQLRVPYRESKLTRVLQDSLGGTSRALMIACLNPGEYQESVHTVSLAARSRHISNFLSSAKKENTPKVKVDMEAKLRAWLESKGKTKSTQRPKVVSSPFTSKTPSSLCSVKKVNMCPSSVKAKLFSNQGASGLKQRAPDVPFRSLFGSRHDFISVLEALDHVNGTNLETKLEVSEERDKESNNCKSDNQVVREEKNANVESVNPVRSSPATKKTNAFQSPPRKALSPIITNINIENVSEKEKRHIFLSDPDNIADNTFQVLGTPLDKLHTRSSNLKSSLAQEYIEFLNAANREELLEIRGIGQKLADYIIELREESPLKSLNDLEKLGLSSKQVQNLFGKAAKILFE
ncbi:PREDICTED: kinesin-like protein KIN-10B isoform X1 [Ipomoea nil]|uniref:kinesin-like protein KIN-10B isoform X1 n=1 Tax=Ipomoea nil TaxID=35883 RepID=UPI000900DB49|nr:PREDICTED: kinesin-like protein KIN-10B isoform X1 [Ipomoea nil]XP_019186863.1 PREDICTED: kinesin-like protein KIN-10B isoform X1 [Ipomoea nil]